jgi:ABC-type cobalamin/Fe3+-siderophores transport system ATPase subunit
MTAVSRGPLFVLAGAPGSGKTTLLPHLIEQSDGIVVIDMDEILEEGALLGVPIATSEAAPIWPAYNRLWDRFVEIVRRSGSPVLMLSPAPSPDEVNGHDADPVRERWALLDCPDEMRRSRLDARGWTEDQIADAMADAHATRALISKVFDGTDDPHELARHVLGWITHQR